MFATTDGKSLTLGENIKVASWLPQNDILGHPKNSSVYWTRRNEWIVAGRLPWSSYDLCALLWWPVRQLHCCKALWDGRDFVQGINYCRVAPERYKQCYKQCQVCRLIRLRRPSRRSFERERYAITKTPPLRLIAFYTDKINGFLRFVIQQRLRHIMFSITDDDFRCDLLC